MQVIQNDPNLWKMDPGLFLKLQNALDENETYKRLIEVLPSRYTKDLVLHIDIDGRKSYLTPAKVMLNRLGSQGVSVSMMVKWLEEIGLERILTFLKDDEPLVVTVQPAASIQVAEGTELKLSCRAKSFPSPKYQWFRGEEELLLQQDSELFIPEAKMEDSGVYICRVHTIRRKSGTYSWAFTTTTDVSVIPRRQLFEEMNADMKSILMNNLSKELNSCTVTRRQKNENSRSLNSLITIFRQPVSEVKLVQGGSILLTCEGHCDYPLKYQWYCNGRPVPDANTSKFCSLNIKPDPTTGETTWDYQCEVSHELDKVLSRSVNVELLPADDSTQHFASEKVAILIANDEYVNMVPLYTPANDVTTLAEMLHQMDFKILALRNLAYQEMLKAVKLLCKMLTPNAYVVVYFAGHGFEICRQIYLQPVDSADEVDLKTCLCVDMILECLQQHDPALNVLLIDTCRTHPFKEGQCISQEKHYLAEKKANTVFGFATSSMCPSHECDGEPNSFFMKYLKEFLPQKLKIQDVLYNVQRQFKTDPLVGKIQRPFVGSNLQESRCLHDKVEKSDESLFDKILDWTDLKRSLFMDWVCDVKRYNVEIVLEFQHHRGIFCNGMDIHIYLDIGESAPMEIINQMEFLLVFQSQKIQNVAKQILCEINNEVNSVCKQTIFELTGLQTIKEALDFRLLMKHRPTQQILLSESITLGYHPVLDLNLNENIHKNFNEMNIKP